MKGIPFLHVLLLLNSTTTPMMNNQNSQKSIQWNISNENQEIKKMIQQIEVVQKYKKINIEDITTIILKSNLSNKLKINICSLLNQSNTLNRPGPMSPHATWNRGNHNTRQPWITPHNIDTSTSGPYRPTFKQSQEAAKLALNMIHDALEIYLKLSAQK